MSGTEFVLTELTSAVGGTEVIYQLDVRWQPAPRITADANGIYLTGQHIVAGRERLNRLMACMEAAWSDHVALKAMAERKSVPSPLPAENILALAHGKSPSEQGGSSV